MFSVVYTTALDRRSHGGLWGDRHIYIGLTTPERQRERLDDTGQSK